jgi:hypothetical protein
LIHISGFLGERGLAGNNSILWFSDQTKEYTDSSYSMQTVRFFVPLLGGGIAFFFHYKKGGFLLKSTIVCAFIGWLP